MEVLCPIDQSCSHQIAALLQPPSPLPVQEYFQQLISRRQCHGVQVKQNGEFGKGVFAQTDFEEEQLIFKDQMLVGAQHPSNKIDCLVCSYCFKFIGSIELQIGRKLYLKSLGLGISPHNECQNSSSDEEDQDNHYVQNHLHSENGASSSSTNTVPSPTMAVESLMNGELALPYSNKFPLPSVVSCPSGCEEAFYCSKSCAEADWESFHSLLCAGEKSESLSRKALLKFMQHANETNDIFLLAAKAISFTILRYRKLKASHHREKEKTAPSILGTSDLSMLLEAWKPISIGHKRRWWDCIALPDDIDTSNEPTFRRQIQELAFTSLQLLKEAIFYKECEPLFSLEIYGHIIGMFELNNLDLVVASPVEDYFLYIDDLPNPEKKEAEKITKPFLDALGDDYAICCQGTAFFPLQSCMNHSCCPNAKAFKREEDRDGQATIIALRPVCKGEEMQVRQVFG
ncbi:hypothetical protein PTKIN_Ptkin10aG0082400 [Pterospermum kingtungense]